MCGSVREMARIVVRGRSAHCFRAHIREEVLCGKSLHLVGRVRFAGCTVSHEMHRKSLLLGRARENHFSEGFGGPALRIVLEMRICTGFGGKMDI